MLSYQHAYHAGNMADVHKHALLCVMLDYLTQKDKPLSYIETHAGRGLYRLDGPEAQRTGEAAAGIGRTAGWFAPDHPYARRLAEVRAQYGVNAYPGSPLLAALALRRGDPIHLAELHPREHEALAATLSPFGAHLRREDGFAMARALCPPTPRRGLLLIDPSFEVKDDYHSLPPLIRNLHRKWNVGIIALWYPLLRSGVHQGMLAALESEGFPDALRHEVPVRPAREGHGMVGSGMFILNAPWGIEAEAARLSALFAAAQG